MTREFHTGIPNALVDPITTPVPESPRFERSGYFDSISAPGHASDSDEAARVWPRQKSPSHSEDLPQPRSERFKKDSSFEHQGRIDSNTIPTPTSAASPRQTYAKHPRLRKRRSNGNGRNNRSAYQRAAEILCQSLRVDGVAFLDASVGTFGGLAEFTETSTIFFDSMIAKIIVWAPNRQLAISEMARVLANSACIGVRTNQQFLQSCLLHPEFQNPSYTTSFIPDNLDRLLLNPYADGTLLGSPALSVIPCLWIRKRATTDTSRPFQHVRRGFRNQFLDPVNAHMDIVTSRLSEPLVCCWSHLRQRPESSHCVARTFPIPPAEYEQTVTDGVATVASKVTAAYNELSRRLQRASLTANASDEQSFDVRLENGAETSTKAVHGGSWTYEDISANVDGHRVIGTVVANTRQLRNRSSSQSAGAVQLMWHLPILGDWFEFKVHSMLTFHESLRQSVAAVSSSAVKQLFAPMPCKVVTVQKDTGQIAKEGDLVVVVESMKMEINMYISAAGKMRVYVEQGQAVEEGTLLCEVE